MCTSCGGTCGTAGGQVSARMVQDAQAALAEAFRDPGRDVSVEAAGRLRNELRAAFNPRLRAAIDSYESSMHATMIRECREGRARAGLELDCAVDVGRRGEQWLGETLECSRLGDRS